jgi:hypothetical protein
MASSAFSSVLYRQEEEKGVKIKIETLSWF